MTDEEIKHVVASLPRKYDREDKAEYQQIVKSLDPDYIEKLQIEISEKILE